VTVQENVMAGFPDTPVPDTDPTAPDPDTGPPAGAGPLGAHPITSLLIGLLVAASIACTLIVPIYASVTPKVGDFPFFYFYLLAYMPLVALALWAVRILQRRLGNPTGGQQ
jgi:hypothetical protein